MTNIKTADDTPKCLVCGKGEWAHAFGYSWEHRYETKGQDK